MPCKAKSTTPLSGSASVKVAFKESQGCECQVGSPSCYDWLIRYSTSDTGLPNSRTGDHCFPNVMRAIVLPARTLHVAGSSTGLCVGFRIPFNSLREPNGGIPQALHIWRAGDQRISSPHRSVRALSYQTLNVYIPVPEM
jgi:hypothetical protein